MSEKVKVYERILQLLEAEGINTLIGVPDPGFVHMFVTAERRGCREIVLDLNAYRRFSCISAAASSAPFWSFSSLSG